MNLTNPPTKQIPLLTPTLEDVRDWDKYYKRIITEGLDNDTGAALVQLPEEEWSPSAKSEIKFNNPPKFIVTNVETQIFTKFPKKVGRGLCFTLVNEHMGWGNDTTIDEFFTSPIISEDTPIVDDSPLLIKLQKYFWNYLENRQPMYAAGNKGTLFDEKQKIFNLGSTKFNHYLRAQISDDIYGVIESYLYGGLWSSCFGLHSEDKDLGSINYLHKGKPKIWYVIPQKWRKAVNEKMGKEFPSEKDNCEEFLRHKNFLLSPDFMRMQNIPFATGVQKQGQYMVLLPGVLHQGFNTGKNVSEAVNFGSPDWIPIGINDGICKCDHSLPYGSVDIDVSRFHKSEVEKLEAELENTRRKLDDLQNKLTSKNVEASTQNQQSETEDETVILPRANYEKMKLEFSEKRMLEEYGRNAKPKNTPVGKVDEIDEKGCFHGITPPQCDYAILKEELELVSVAIEKPGYKLKTAGDLWQRSRANYPPMTSRNIGAAYDLMGAGGPVYKDEEQPEPNLFFTSVGNMSGKITTAVMRYSRLLSILYSKKSKKDGNELDDLYKKYKNAFILENFHRMSPLYAGVYAKLNPTEFD